METIIEFKRPAPATAKPADTRVVFISEGGREIIAFYLDSFDEITRYLSNPDVSYESRVKFINDWRERLKMGRLGCAETRHE